MVRILIIEDEIPARNKLKRFISALEIETEIIAEISTVQEGINFLENTEVDIIFSDIELLDGNVFEIYANTSVKCPIIFSTAYDQFWMDAFESNGIEYLLKPYSQERFEKAWGKFLMLHNPLRGNDDVIKKLKLILGEKEIKSEYKKRFSINSQQGIYFLETENILYFEAENSVIFAYDIFDKRHLTNFLTLKEVEEKIDPYKFFRVNRSELVQKQWVEKIERHSKNTLSIKLKGLQKILFTSQSNTSNFRKWIDE